MKNECYRHFIEGIKIYLRGISIDDVNENYYRWMNDEEITAFTESRFMPYSIEKIKDYVTKIDEHSNTVFLAIIDKATNKHIGNIKLGNINWIHRSADIGIIIGEKDFWGKGYASEAIELITNYAFNKLNLNKLVAGCYIDNKGSINAFKKVGFQEEGLLKKQFFYKGDFTDSLLLGITLDMFNTNRGK